jgi:nucleoside phosphorylase
LGTCGGIEGAVKQGEIILVTKTIIYDIFELMGDPVEHVKFYETTIDNSWIGPDSPIMSRQAILLSADRDLFLQDVMELQAKYNAIAADWESGSIAWVAHKNDKTCLILRGVTDLVNSTLGEAYNGNMSIFLQNTKKIMRDLLDSVPKWIELVNRYDRRGLEK